MTQLRWEQLNNDLKGANYASGWRTYRTKVPGGWLVVVESETSHGISFYPDPQHKWDGNSL